MDSLICALETSVYEEGICQIFGAIYSESSRTHFVAAPDGETRMCLRIMHCVDVAGRLTSRQLGGAEDNAQPEEGAVEEDDDEKTSSIGISAKEGREISQLLSKFEYEVGEIGDFQSKVQQELFSLQVRVFLASAATMAIA